ncbi:MAG: flagellar basal body rod protein FlgC [Thermodesulfobacteriota bacterium]
MNLFKAMQVSGSGLHAQRVAINGISMNLANLQTTRAEGGEPYRRRRVVLSSQSADQRFADVLLNKLEVVGHLRRTHRSHFSEAAFSSWEISGADDGVKAELIVDPRGYKMIYDPSHPDADASGYVLMPDINPIEEMVALLMALRSYEANVTAFNAAKTMVLRALEIGR